ncbi:hypothetical protein NIE88_00265 [Sporolactobacillus shoreicorticis]|uniref:Uncharacterized protein n=1 Tax=Sporolactobacillus shoreicorticis TaxID=1923877 RepID=A0ABW5S4A4_9BACL|nr:hypothetical protein [Sporolactobacillus shoreicorticis]MCO7124224.1 hypothetical protein [Sporolactobacillus shoreicorticis]
MHKFNFKLGEHYFKIQAESASLINLFLSTFSTVKKTEQKTIDMTVNLHYVIPAMYSDSSINLEKSKYNFRQDNFIIDINPEYNSTNLYIIDSSSLRQAFLTIYSSFIVHQKWGLLLEADCIFDQQSVHMLCGDYGEPSAQSMDAHNFFSKPLVLIKILPEHSFVLEFPFGSAGLERASDSLPVSSLCFLQRSFENKRITVGRTYSLLRLLDLVFYWPRSTEQTKSVIHLLKLLIHQVSIFNCYFQNKEAVRELIS